MKYLFKITLSTIFIFATTLSFSQKTNSKTSPIFKPPVVKTLIGIRSGFDTVHVEEATQLIGLPLMVKDKNGNTYKIDNYRFLYREKGFIENTETGRPEVNYTMVASRFDNSPLPKVWIENIQQKIKPGEELYFFEILVSDKEGRMFYAPDVRLIIK